MTRRTSCADRCRSRPATPAVFAPHVPQEYGGCGLDMRGQAVVFEEAGYSLLGPLALNCAAPDEGNMHLLEVVATDGAEGAATSGRWPPGEIALVLRDDRAGAGRGLRPGRRCRPPRPRTATAGCINGRKWFITGADGAAFAICMARTGGSAGDRGGATMFLVDADTPGHAGHARHRDARPGLLRRPLRGRTSTTARVGQEAVLGEVDQGFDYAQVRLAPARLTHCMRWLGHRPARPGHRASTAPRDARVVRRPAGRPRHGPGDGRRLGDRHRGSRGC